MAKEQNDKGCFQWRTMGEENVEAADYEFDLLIDESEFLDSELNSVIDNAMRSKLLNVKPSTIPEVLNYHLQRASVSKSLFFSKIDLLSSTLTENAKSYDALHLLKRSEPKVKEIIEKWLKYQDNHVARITTRLPKAELLEFFRNEFKGKLDEKEIRMFLHSSFAHFNPNQPSVLLKPKMKAVEIFRVMYKLYQLDKTIHQRSLAFHFKQSFAPLANYQVETIRKKLSDSGKK